MKDLSLRRFYPHLVLIINFFNWPDAIESENIKKVRPYFLVFKNIFHKYSQNLWYLWYTGLVFILLILWRYSVFLHLTASTWILFTNLLLSCLLIIVVIQSVFTLCYFRLLVLLMARYIVVYVHFEVRCQSFW